MRYLVPKGEQEGEMRFKVDMTAPPAELLAEFEAIAQSFKWE